MWFGLVEYHIEAEMKWHQVDGLAWYRAFKIVSVFFFLNLLCSRGVLYNIYIGFFFTKFLTVHRHANVRPYVTVTFRDKMLRTSTVDSSNPTWNEQIVIPIK